MNRLSYFKTSLLFSVVLTGLSVHAELGFYPPNHKKIPVAVQKAASSVFMTRTVSMTHESLHTVDLTTSTPESVVESLRASGSFDSYDLQVIRQQLAFCEKRTEEQKKQCYLSLDIRSGSAFLLDDGKTLWTNTHVVSSFMESMVKLAEISISDQIRDGQKISVFLFDSNGNMAVNPYENTVRIAAGPELTPMAESSGNFFAEDSDYMRLRLDKSAGTPLQLAEAPATSGETIYVAGYPACTGCDTSTFIVPDPETFSDRSPLPNSPGSQLRITLGEVLNLNNKSGLPDSMQLNNADSQHGNSGGPILNKYGHVVAIHTGGKSLMSEARLINRMSRSVIPPDFFGSDD